MPNLGCLLGWASYSSDKKLKVDIGRILCVLLCFHNSKCNVKDPYEGLCKGVSFLWICVFSKLVLFFFFNTIVTNDESDEQNFHTFCINLHLSFFEFEFNSIEYESNCI
jgi:hypothetical protein